MKYFFFFSSRRRHTRCGRDWSSDVCSSDLKRIENRVGSWGKNSLMVGLSGLEKFSHLEDKIYRTIELTKTLRQEKESLEKELSAMRRNRGGSVPFEQQRLEKQVEALLAERDIIRAKVEAMLDAVAALDAA